MVTTYRIHVNELSMELINSIKIAIEDKTVEIIVSDEVNETSSAFHFWSEEAEDIYQDYLK